MVGLGDGCDVAVLEPLHDVHLPERAAAIERPSHHLLGELGQLRLAARGGERGAAHVVLEVEVGVFDPERVVEREGDREQPPPERRQQVEPALDQIAHLLERVPARNRARVEDRSGGHVHVVRGSLEVEERGVHAGEPLHGDEVYYRPVWPNPPVPRSDRGRSSTGTKRTASTA